VSPAPFGDRGLFHARDVPHWYMDQDKIDCLRDYYDTTDVAEHFAGATLQTDRRSSLDDPVGLPNDGGACRGAHGPP